MNTNPAPDDATACLISPAVFSSPQINAAPLKLGIMASGSGSNFEAVAEAIASQQLNAQIQVLIYNNPGIKAAARAEKWGVTAVLLNHRDYKKREELDSKIVHTLRQYGWNGL
jgi:phosphoribosylglycinamide formyltransferase-1